MRNIEKAKGDIIPNGGTQTRIQSILTNNGGEFSAGKEKWTAIKVSNFVDEEAIFDIRTSNPTGHKVLLART